MLKRLMLLILALVMLAGAALAEALPAFDAYVAAFPAPEGAEWKEKGDLRVLKLDGEMELHVCLIGEEVAAVTLVAPVETELTATAEEVFRALNVFTEEALDQLPEIAEATELEGMLITPMAGKAHVGIALRSAESEAEWVWQPLLGGKKYHSKPLCGRTEAPRLETKEAAEALGFTPCSKCFKEE